MNYIIDTISIKWIQKSTQGIYYPASKWYHNYLKPENILLLKNHKNYLKKKKKTNHSDKFPIKNIFK